jgi:D-glycerate 3-kinase
MNAIEALIEAEGLPADYAAVVEYHWQPLADRIASEATKRPLVVGINGAQGSGKSTLCIFLEQLLADRGLNAVTLSLDDLYLTRAERAALATQTHPLFMTRGVPGTHDVALGEAILHDLAAGCDTFLPAFDKATDDREPLARGPLRQVDVLLFEGWCVGAVPQPAAALREPVNRLEADEDPECSWRREVNRRLATDYAELFARIDLLVMLKVEDFEAVRANRKLQEDKLAARRPRGAGVMDDAALDRFLMHYERLTRWLLAEMPARADVVIEIGADQRPK